MDVVLFQADPLDVVDEVVADQGVLPGIHLQMEGGKPLAGAIVVNHQVMEAQHLLMAADFSCQGLLQLRVRSVTQQGADGVPGDADAGPDDEQGHQQTHDTVNVPAEGCLHQGGQQHGPGGDAVVAAVGGGGLQGGGLNQLPHFPIEEGHPQLHPDGGQQHGSREPGEGHVLRVQNLLHGAFGQLRADEQNHGRHAETGDVLHPGVTVGVVLIGRLPGQMKAQQGHQGGRGVGQVVEGVGGDGHGACQGAHQELAQKQQHVAHDAHDARQPPTGGPDLWVLTVTIIGNKNTQQKPGHTGCLLYNTNFGAFYHG